MQSKAYRLTGFAAVASAVGFLLRWLQGIQIIDEETGLARRGAGISAVVMVFIVLVAGALAFAAYRFGKYGTPEKPESALETKNFLHRAVNIVPSVLLGICGLVQLLQADAAHWGEGQILLRRILGVLTLCAAYGSFLISAGVQRKDRRRSCQIGAVLLILFGGVWLIAIYKSVASNPVIWSFAVEVLAVCAALLAYYHLAGYFFEEPTPRRSIFYCFLGAFLCVMAAVDEHTLGESVCFASVALHLLALGYTLTVNLGRQEESAPDASDAPEAPEE